jgi:hypothetical protein
LCSLLRWQALDLFRCELHQLGDQRLLLMRVLLLLL